MPQIYYNYDEIKRKLRELKKLEIKLREKQSSLWNNRIKSPSNFQNTDLIWNKFFSVSSKDAKYSIIELSKMTKEEFKEVITEYICYVYYSLYNESGFSDNVNLDIETLADLGLPVYADQNEIKRRFRELAKESHPDNGGDSQKFIKLMEQFKKFKNMV